MRFVPSNSITFVQIVRRRTKTAVHRSSLFVSAVNTAGRFNLNKDFYLDLPHRGLFDLTKNDERNGRGRANRGRPLTCRSHYHSQR